MKDLNAAFKKALMMCNEVGIRYGTIESVHVNRRLTSAWGRCKTRRSTNTSTIEINKLLVDDGTSDRALLETLLHEICHTVCGGDGHGAVWLRNVERLNRAYGLNIKAGNSASEKGVSETALIRNAKYVLRCNGCGRTITRSRACGLTRSPGSYRCGKCHGTITLVSRR